MASSTSRSTSADHLGVVGQLGQRVYRPPVLLRPRGGHVGIEHDQRRDERALIADGSGLADERDRLERRLEVGGADVLAAGRDDQLLLAVDDAQVAVVVELADVAGVQPAVGVERLGGLLRVVEVADEDVAAAADHLAVVAELHIATRDCGADGAGLDAARCPRHRPRRLGHAVDLRQRHADGAVPLEQLPGDRRRAGDRELRLVETDDFAHGTKRNVLQEVPGRVLFRGRLAPRPRDRDRFRRLDALVELTLVLRVRGDRSHHARADLLPHARNAERDLRAYLSEVRRHLSGIRTHRDLVRVDRLLVVARHPFGDVGHRQVRHDAETGEVDVVAERTLEALGGPHHVVVGEHHALGRAGRPRCVDHRGQRFGVDVGRTLLEIRVPVSVEEIASVVRDDHDLLEGLELAPHLLETSGESVVLHDGHLGLAMTDEVRDLLG